MTLASAATAWAWWAAACRENPTVHNYTQRTLARLRVEALCQ